MRRSSGTKAILEEACREGYCVAAFNVVDFLSMEAVVRAAEACAAPVIMQTSSAAIKRHGITKLVAMADAAVAEAQVPVALHLDHGTDPRKVKAAIDAGYSSVMIDASSKPFAENVAVTRDVVEYAHARGIAVEGEIGVVAGVEDDIVISQDDAIYTTPEEALTFQRETGIDFLAAAIGTAHGFYKVKPRLDIETLRALRQAAGFPLVVHGATGLKEDVVEALVAAGAAKMNISTQIKQTYIDSLDGYMSEHRDEYNVMKVLQSAYDGLTEMLSSYLRLLKSAGRAAKRSYISSEMLETQASP